MTISPDAIARYRLHCLGLIPGSPLYQLSDPAGVAHHHLAMQGQDWGASQWAVGSRLPGAKLTDVLAAYDDGHIVRSWPMRGTVHVVSAEDLPWMLRLMGVRVLSGVQRRWEYLGINEQMLERARDVAVELLRGGRRCLRSEFAAAIEESGIDLQGQRNYHTIWYLAQTGTICNGPTRDGEQELVLLDEWIKNPRVLSRDEALAELGIRYITSHGPATVDDLVHWTKLTKRDCKTAFEANEDELVKLTYNYATYFMRRDHLEVLSELDVSIEPRVLALTAFDEHLLGYKDRSAVLDPKYANLVDPARNGVFRPTIVANGRVVATWKKTRRTNALKIEISPFTRITAKDRKDAMIALERYGAFYDTAVAVT